MLSKLNEATQVTHSKNYAGKNCKKLDKTQNVKTRVEFQNHLEKSVLPKQLLC